MRRFLRQSLRWRVDDDGDDDDEEDAVDVVATVGGSIRRSLATVNDDDDDDVDVDVDVDVDEDTDDDSDGDGDDDELNTLRNHPYIPTLVSISKHAEQALRRYSTNFAAGQRWSRVVPRETTSMTRVFNTRRHDVMRAMLACASGDSNALREARQRGHLVLSRTPSSPSVTSASASSAIHLDHSSGIVKPTKVDPGRSLDMWSERKGVDGRDGEAGDVTNVLHESDFDVNSSWDNSHSEWSSVEEDDSGDDNTVRITTSSDPRVGVQRDGYLYMDDGDDDDDDAVDDDYDDLGNDSDGDYGDGDDDSDVFHSSTRLRNGHGGVESISGVDEYSTDLSASGTSLIESGSVFTSTGCVPPRGTGPKKVTMNGSTYETVAERDVFVDSSGYLGTAVVLGERLPSSSSSKASYRSDYYSVACSSGDEDSDEGIVRDDNDGDDAATADGYTDHVSDDDDASTPADGYTDHVSDDEIVDTGYVEDVSDEDTTPAASARTPFARGALRVSGFNQIATSPVGSSTLDQIEAAKAAKRARQRETRARPQLTRVSPRKHVKDSERDSSFVLMEDIAKFHRALDRLRGPRLNAHDKLKLYRDISSMTTDFIYDARAYGSIIVQELGLPPEAKSILPINASGVLGGEKYQVGAIYFKFANDKRNMFHADAKAPHKVAGHELKALSQIASLNLPGLRWPFMCLMDFLGHRLVALSVVPIGDDTLMYGTADGGKTCHFSHQPSLRVANHIGKALNLKRHRVARTPHLIRTAADLEIHAGLDAPDKPPKGQSEAVFYQFFRPEFCLKYPKPLAPDAMTNFLAKDERRAARKEIKEAHVYLVDRLIPTLAEKMDREGVPPSATSPLRKRKLVERMHAMGINARYLAALRSHLTTPYWRLITLMEIVVRSLKRQLEAKLRQGLVAKNQRRLYGTGLLVGLTVDYLNLLFGRNPDSDALWQKVILNDIRRHFRAPLHDFEEAKKRGISFRQWLLGKHHNDALQSFFHASHRGGMAQPTVSSELCIVLAKRSGVQFSKMFATALLYKPTLWHDETPLDETDVKGITMRVKHLPICTMSDGIVKRLQAAEATSDRAYDMIMHSCVMFEKSLQMDPRNRKLLRNLAVSYAAIGEMDEARFYWRSALGNRSERRSAGTLFKYALWCEDNFELDMAESAYLEAIERAPHKIKYALTYADFLATERRQFRAAKQLYDTILKMHNGCAAAWNNCGCMLLRVKPSRAHHYLRNAIQRERHAAFHFNYSVFLESRGKVERAEKFMRVAMALIPSWVFKRSFTLSVVTSQAEKLREIKEIVGPRSRWRYKQCSVHVAEDDSIVSLKNRVREKVKAAFRLLCLPCVVELPYLRVHHNGITHRLSHSDFASKVSTRLFKFAQKYEGAKASICVYVAYTPNGKDVVVCKGCVKGKIVVPSKAAAAFAPDSWDSVFASKYPINFRRVPYLQLNHYVDQHAPNTTVSTRRLATAGVTLGGLVHAAGSRATSDA